MSLARLAPFLSFDCKHKQNESNPIEDHSCEENRDSTAWFYQVCNELGMFTTTTSESHPFGRNIPVNYWIEQCQQFFGNQFNQSRIEEGVAKTNRIYTSGLNSNLTNVLFVNGDQDPWHPRSVLKDLNPTVKALIIRNQAHCSDMFPNPTNLELIEAQEEIQLAIEAFLTNSSLNPARKRNRQKMTQKVRSGVEIKIEDNSQFSTWFSSLNNLVESVSHELDLMTKWCLW